jgi:D-beta-D-heptose 7-phosphate kinase/D-beta-D-heptose 1-phosphate adenosyltransferase
MSRIIVNGTFDVLHLGHIRLLEFARSQPDSYISVLIDSDRRVRELKGPARPVNNEYERCTLLFALKCVDRVDVFDSDEELEELIRKFAPDIMIKGSDYRDQPIIGAKYCKHIKFYDRLEKYSTTNKIQSIIDRG